MRSLGVSDFADDLDISRDTAKRLFRKQVFPREWLMKTNGGHWRIEIDENGTRLQTARRLYQRWKLFSRKPQASKSLPSPYALDKLAMTLMEMRLLGEPASVENLDEFQKVMLSPEGSQKFSEIEAKFRLEQSSDREHAILLLMSKLWEIKDRWGIEYEPCPSDIADSMPMSVASLYRKPFGKDVIDEARDRLQTYLHGSVAEVHCLSQSFEGEITPSVIQKHLVVSKDKAETLFGEWEATFAKTESADFGANLANRDFSFESSSKQSERPKASKFQKEAKRIRDNNRNELKRQFMVQWEDEAQETLNGRWVFLEAVPRFEFEEIAKARDGKKTRANLGPLVARMDSKKEYLGCVYENSGEILFKGLNGIPIAEDRCDSFQSGVDRLVTDLKDILSRDERFGGVDWEEVRNTAFTGLTQEPQKSTDKTH